MAAAGVAGTLAADAEVRLLAPAKVNLGLEVLGRREDGYHELRTIFQTVSLHDRLVLRRRGRGVLVECAALPGLGAGNLAHRAAALFLERTRVRGGVTIDLDKRIPSGGGLGGGSSDAAAVLVGCCRLFGLRPPTPQLLEWAAELGSDVPFFIAGGSALGSGRGERVEGLGPWPGDPAVLLYLPPEGLSTAEVYRNLSPSALTPGRGALTILLALWTAGDLRRFGAALFNDLEGPAFALAPQLAAAKRALLEAGAAGSVLCGSGSSVVALFGSVAAAERARRRLRGRLPGRLLRTRFVRARSHWGVVKR